MWELCFAGYILDNLLSLDGCTRTTQKCTVYTVICLSVNFFDLLRHSWKQSTIPWLQAGQWPLKPSKGETRSYLAVRELPESRLNEGSVILYELRLLLYYLIKFQGSVCTLDCVYNMQCQSRIYWRGKWSIMCCNAKGWVPCHVMGGSLLHPSAAYLLCLQTSLCSAAALNGVPITLKGAVCTSVTKVLRCIVAEICYVPELVTREVLAYKMQVQLQTQIPFSAWISVCVVSHKNSPYMRT